MIRFVLDPALNLYFDLTIRGTDTVCIDWTLQVPLSFKWVEQGGGGFLIICHIHNHTGYNQ